MRNKKKIGRNDPCSCGSGKKFKHCCGSTVSDPFAALSSLSFDDVAASGQVGDTLNVYGSKMLSNRVNREASAIATDFDELCRDHVKDIEEVYSTAASVLHYGMMRAKQQNDDLRSTLAIVLSNTLKSFTAAFVLLRGGWRLQPYQCIRNAFETLSVAIHLATTPGDLERFKRDELDSTKTFNSAKRLMPIFGRVYGDMSEQFIHIGKPFRHIQRANKYAPDEKDLWGCLLALMTLIWFTYEVVELVFYHFVEHPKFWKHLGGNQYEYAPTGGGLAWRARLVARYKNYGFRADAAEKSKSASK
ncbi:MAG: YecA family protein [Terriglobales bacterium]